MGLDFKQLGKNMQNESMKIEIFFYKLYLEREENKSNFRVDIVQ